MSSQCILEISHGVTSRSCNPQAMNSAADLVVENVSFVWKLARQQPDARVLLC